jgi:hypothetical protein
MCTDPPLFHEPVTPQIHRRLYAASDITTCAVPASRDRMKFVNANKFHRKTGV